MKKILVVLGIVFGAALATSAAWAEKSDPPATGGNPCVACIHDCTDAVDGCMKDASHARNTCYSACMADFRTALAACTSQPAGTAKRECQKKAGAALVSCKKPCDTDFAADKTDCAKNAEETCLKDCVQMNPSDNSNAPPPCADLCVK